MRKITVFSMADNSSETITTSATTWGAVLEQSQKISQMIISDMKIVIKETKAVIESRDTILPDGDIKIFLTPGKVKSGINPQLEYMRKGEEIFEEFKQVIEADILNMEKLAEDIEFCKSTTVVKEDSLPF